MSSQPRSPLIYVYTTSGDVGALLRYPYLYNLQGEWIGWVTPERHVYSVHGHYVGWLSDDPRVLRSRSSDYLGSRRTPPAAPPVVVPAGRMPLAPMLPELAIGMMDVLDEAPELLPALDFGELKDDLN
jgi:hypothetical protein